MDDLPETPKPTYNGADLQKQGTLWMERIRASEKREHDWRKDAEAAEAAYAGDAKAKSGKLYDFNILHSNVETIVPAIYNSTPIPDIRCRWIEAEGEPPQPPQPQQGQPPDPRVAMAFQKAMQDFQAKQQYDQACKDYGDMIERAITVQIDDNRLDTEIERSAQDAFLSGRGIVRVKMEADIDGDEVGNERIAFEAVSWRDYRQGPGTRWDGVGWIAFKHSLPRETVEDEIANPDMLASQTAPADKLDDNDDDIVFWEVWHKEKREVCFVREHDGKILNVKPDPLGLKDFYPIPHPVQPISLTGKLIPVCPFTVYRKLADELDLTTKRINKIMQGLKVRGIVAGDASKLVELADADDNEIRVETDLEGLAQTGGLEKAVMWWPVEQAIKVLVELYKQRDMTKQAIYEITGISDIVRGASQAQETATAQQIKTQWGSLRIQKMQRLIERQVRDVFCLMAEIVTSKFSEKTLFQMTAIPMTDGIRALMQQPVLASYRVDVESDSTVRADLTRQKQDMTEFLTGTANFFKTMGPLIQESPEAAGPVADIYASMARVFKLGREAEDALEKLKNIAEKAANQPRPNPEAEQAQAEMQIKAQDLQLEHQRETTRMQLDAQNQSATVALEKWKAELSALTSIEVARIGAKTDMDSELLTAELEAALHMSTQQHEKEMAGAQIAADQNAQERQIGADQQAATQKALPKRPPTRAQNDAKNRDEILGKIGEMIAPILDKLSAAQAPKVLRYGPDGRVAAIEHVGHGVMPIVRGPDNRISHVGPIITQGNETVQ